MKKTFLALCLGIASIACAQQKNAANNHSKTSIMKEYSLLVRVPTTYTTEQAQAVGPQWDAALKQWKEDNVYVLSFAFPGKSAVVSGADKAINYEPVLSGNLRVVSNIVLRAASVENAVALAKGCPILEYGGSVEVREIPQRQPVVGN